ncbi:hypothetical protein IZ6_07720 [Terrihabitans soli]|uniref:Uncharacterized protein n=1 Tax=Terrihabitans soli TaxID=708113 RepID=A0A6S6QQ13_9HYPH|nr:hypothetical protein [Terrihabitans soli]BCJ90037.1 hypothetical protein IZ6_07720 [Terrihabitans soli]
MRRYNVPVTTASDGSATEYTPRIAGKIHSITYKKHGSTPFADTVDFAITVEATSEGLWTQANVTAGVTKYPRVACDDLVGVAATLDGTRALRDKVGIANDRVKIAITNGGDAKLGTFIVVTD